LQAEPLTDGGVALQVDWVSPYPLPSFVAYGRSSIVNSYRSASELSLWILMIVSWILKT
jgi:hypothetical protein